MPSRSSKKPKRDFSQIAFDVVQELTEDKLEKPTAVTIVGEALDDAELRKALMREMGRRGGQKGGKARALKATPG